MQYKTSAICGLLEPVLSFSLSMRRKKLEGSGYEIALSYVINLSKKTDKLGKTVRETCSFQADPPFMPCLHETRLREVNAFSHAVQ